MFRTQFWILGTCVGKGKVTEGFLAHLNTYLSNASFMTKVGGYLYSGMLKVLCATKRTLVIQNVRLAQQREQDNELPFLRKNGSSTVAVEV